MYIARIGLALMTLTLSVVCPAFAFAAESTSFRMEGGSMNVAAPGMQSDSFQGQGAIDWHATTVTGQNYKIVPPHDAGRQPPPPSSSSVPASSSVASSIGAQSSGHTENAGGGTRRSEGIVSSAAASVQKSSRRVSSASSDGIAVSSRVSEAWQASSGASSDATSSFDFASSAALSQAGTASSSMSIDEELPLYTPDESVQEPDVTRPAAPETTESADTAATVIMIMLVMTLIFMGAALVIHDLYASAFMPWIIALAVRFRSVLYLLVVILAIAAAFLLPAIYRASAASVPLSHAYDGRLLTASGSPVITAVSIRLSYWSDADIATGDVAVDGSINTGAAAYLDWQETHVVTPDSNGYFSVEMGSISSLPAYADLPEGVTVYLQVEVKDALAADTAFESLDPDTVDTSVDRTSVLSVPYASVAETLQRRSIGTGSGSIPLLQSGGLMPVSTVPGGTNRDTFIIDANNDAPFVTLQFGQSLNETLTYSIASGRFEFSDDVHVDGDLTVTGTVNGVDLSTIGQAVATTGALVLHPGYEGAAFQADGSENVGQLSISHDNISLKNFYLWSSSRTSLQDYDVLLRYTLPDHFSGWNDGMTLQYRSTSGDAANNKLDVQVYDTNGSPVSLSGSALNLAATGWQSTHIEFVGSPVWTAGQQILIRFKLSAKDNYQMHLGELRLSLIETK